MPRQRGRVPDGSARSCLPGLRTAARVVALAGGSSQARGGDVRRQPSLGAIGGEGPCQQPTPQKSPQDLSGARGVETSGRRRRYPVAALHPPTPPAGGGGT